MDPLYVTPDKARLSIHGSEIAANNCDTDYCYYLRLYDLKETSKRCQCAPGQLRTHEQQYSIKIDLHQAFMHNIVD